MKPKWNDQTIVHDILRGNYGVVRDRTWVDPIPYKESLVSIRSSFAKSQVIIADNVVDLMCSQAKENSKKEFSLKHLPRCTPPFKHTVVLFNTPRSSIEPLSVSSVAIHSILINKENDTKEWNDHIANFKIKDDDVFRDFQSKIDEFNWTIVSFMWLKLFNNDVFMIHGWNQAFLDDTGIAKGNYCTYANSDLNDDTSIFIGTMFQTFAFMHCRNIQKLPCDDEFNPRYGKKFRGERVPELKWSRVRITDLPTTRSPHIDAPVNDDLKGKSLHICRGYFAVYKEDGKGLFGRGIYGTFWIPQHVRGNKDFGTTIKDYEVG